MTQPVQEEVRRVSKGVPVLAAVLLLGCWPFGQLNVPMALAALAGTVMGVLNFILLGLAVERAIEMEPDAAKRKMTRSYLLRMGLLGLFLVTGNRAGLPLLGLAVPLIFPRLVILAKSIFRKG